MKSPTKILAAGTKLLEFMEMNVRHRLGRDVIHHFSWEATRQCDSRCKTCGVWKEKVDPMLELAYEDLKHFFSHPLLKSVRYLTVTGGEPFIRHDITDLCVLAHQHTGCRLGLDTNAVNWKRSYNAITEIHQRGVPLKDISVAIAYNGQCHDWSRGIKGNAVNAMNLMLMLRNEGYTVSANFIVLHENHDSIYSTYEMLKKHGIYVGVRPVYQADRFGKNTAPDFTLEEQKTILDQIDRILQDRGQPFFGQAIRRMWTSYFTKEHVGPCLGGIQSFYLTSTGDVLRCNYWNRNHTPLGNIREKPFTEIWQDRPKNVCNNCRIIGWADAFYSFQVNNILRGGV